MKKATFLSTCLFVLALVASCTKTNQPSTPYSNLYGTWKITEQAFDDTNTGILDSNQIVALAPNDVESILFNKDSTGTHFITVNNVKNDFNFRWSLIDDFSEIRMITDGGDTLVSKIASIYETNLTLLNFTTPHVSWSILKRQ